MAKAKPVGVWGIDVGQCALKALRMEMIDGQLTATAFDYVEHPKILSQPDADADQLTREALEKFLSRNTLKGDLVAISVPGQGGLARFVKLPPVEEKKIPDIVKFEAKQQIPFRLEEVVWDYQKIGSGQVSDGFAMETEIGLFAMKRDMVTRYLQHFKDVHVEVQIVQLAPLALCNFMAFDLLPKLAEEGADEEAAGKKRCVVALDIGADNSNLVITDGNRIIWQRPIPLGGNHFTRALSKDLKLTFAKAEHLKRNATKSPDLKKILSALKPVLNDFVGEVQRSLGYFTNTHRDAHVAYMVGLGNAFRLPGLQKFLSEKLQLDVRRLQKLERLQGDAVVTAPQFTENVMSFAVAYGLALQGLAQGRLHTNLLPQEIQFERMVRAKKPWAAAAAAALLLGIGGLTACLASGRSKFNVDNKASPVGKAYEANAQEVKVANDWISKCNSVEDSIKKKQQQTYEMAAGVAEQLDWSLLLKYVNDALPRPDGTHIYRNRERYYTRSARNANTALMGGEPAENLQQDLATVNIEGVLPLYSDDLSGYFERLAKEKPDLEGMPEDERALVRGDKSKLPKAGWVVELRGYTYFRPWRIDPETRRAERDEPREFIKDTLCHNLSRGALLADPKQVADLAKGLGIDPEKLWKKVLDKPQPYKILALVDGKSPDYQKVFWAVLLDDTKQMEDLAAKFREKTDQLKKARDEAAQALEEAKKDETRKKEVAGLQKKLAAPQKALAAWEQELKTWDEQKKIWEKRHEVVWKNVKFVVLYVYHDVENPEPGSFKYINASSLNPVLTGEQANTSAMGAPGAPGAPKGGYRGMMARGPTPGPSGPSPAGSGGGGSERGGEAEKPSGPDRSGWNPLGDVTRDAFGGGQMGGGAAGERGAARTQPEDTGGRTTKKKKTAGQHRYEFVVFFVWQEPLKSESDAENPGGTPPADTGTAK